MSDREITFGYSPCPNDTFAFHALTNGLVEIPGIKIEAHLADVERLNNMAMHGELPLTKLSFHALGHVLDDYALLRSGAALGRGCGPLIVARPGFDPARLGQTKVAVPGHLTTAHLLLSLYLGKKPDVEPMEFSTVMPAVAQGRFDAGLIIHEGRFTYGLHNLEKVADLGQWWEQTTGRPIPLGCIAARRDLGAELIARIEDALAASVRKAWADPEASREYVLANAQEMDQEVVDQHIALYVNDFTEDLGAEGLEAVEEVLARGRESGLLPPSDQPLLMT